jgi:hypothetical protein
MPGSLVIPVLAAAHAIVPLLLLFLAPPVSSASPVHMLALGFYLSWPAWLWPLIKMRRRSLIGFVASLVVSGIALAWAAFPMLLLILIFSGARFHI